MKQFKPETWKKHTLPLATSVMVMIGVGLSIAGNIQLLNTQITHQMFLAHGLFMLILFGMWCAQSTGRKVFVLTLSSGMKRLIIGLICLGYFLLVWKPQVFQQLAPDSFEGLLVGPILLIWILFAGICIPISLYQILGVVCIHVGSLLFAEKNWAKEGLARRTASLRCPVKPGSSLQSTLNKHGLEITCLLHQDAVTRRRIAFYSLVLLGSLLYCGIPVSGLIWGIPKLAEGGDPLSALLGFMVLGIPGMVFCLFRLSPLIQTTKIRLSSATLTIGTYNIFGIGTSKAYDICGISNIRIPSSSKKQYWTLCFDYVNPVHTPTTHATPSPHQRHPKTIFFGQKLNPHDINYLVTYLPDIIRFRCHVVTSVIFGALSSQQDDPDTALYAPDVSDLLVPFYHLTQIIIHTSTYDAYLVERFLTYAVNVIGQEYLKHHVSVDIYGHLNNFHPNLLNSLTNLCKRVTIHQEEKQSHLHEPMKS